MVGLPLDARVLVIGAHPDDIELGCLGTLMLWGAQTRALVLTNGGQAGAGDLRVQEARSALEHAGLDDVHFFGLPDGGLTQALQFATGLVEQHIHDFKPTVILTHTEWDTHPDHRAVRDIVFAAARRQAISIIGYHIISSTQAFPVNMVVDVSAVLGDKLGCLAQHVSQAHKPYFQREYLIDWHKEKLATAVGIQAAECFHVYCSFLQGVHR